jgi:hypothetical protein
VRTNSAKLPNVKPLLLTVVENVLLLMVLSLMALRATYIEDPHIEQIQTQFFLSSEIVSLLMSTALLACFAVWLFVSLLINHFRWRRTSLGYAAALFLLAGVISCFAASNKRAAVTDLVLLLTPMLMAMLLVQLFTSKPKTYLALLLVMAVAVTMTVQCIDQFLDTNETMIADYERNPAEQLRNLNIEPDSLEHWLYEHRLYSNDIRGFLLTSNSAASFFLLSVFAGLGLCMEAFGGRRQPETQAAFVGYVLALLVAAGGLMLTQSKGGIGAFIIGACLLAILAYFGKRLWKHRIVVGIFLLLGIVLGIGALIAYGVRHGRLPGGNSMLVRWQYWQSTAAMIGDHFWTGVGGGNFGSYYFFYKNPAASETIQNPHNFVLSLLSQYGPLGLLAFLAAVLWPVFKSLQQRFTRTDLLASTPQRGGKVLWLGLLGVSVCLFLFVRPMLVDTSFWYQPSDVRSAAYLVLYLFPAGIFVLAFGLLCAVASGDSSIQKPAYYLTPALVCGLVAVLIHNLVDFAIFEPGVWNIFWLVAAVLIACRHNNTAPADGPTRLAVPARLFALLVLLMATGVYLGIAVLPPIKANRLFHRALVSRRPQLEMLEQAIAADTLSPDTAYNAAGMLMQIYAQQRPMVKEPVLLEKAMDFADIAQQRNPAGFKPWRLKSDIALMLADQAEGDKKKDYLQTAYTALSEALDRYPGSDRIHYNLAQIAERLNRPEQALMHYQKAVALEEAYQEQFKLMYPDRRPVISRLGSTAYNTAKAKIEELQKEINR